MALLYDRQRKGATDKGSVLARAHQCGTKICDEYCVTFGWLYRDDHSMLPHCLAIEIGRIEAAEQEFYVI
jgi:hypothetical protein